MRTRIALAVAATAVIAALALSHRSPSHPSAPSTTTLPSAAASAPATHDPAAGEAFVVSWEQRSAALISGTPDDLAAAQRDVAADATREQQVTANLAALGRFRASLPDAAFTYRVAVLAVGTTVHSSDAIEVVVWRVGVIAIAGRGAAQSWATVTYELVWERDAWRILTEASVPGPVPVAPPPSPPSETDARLAAYTGSGAP